VIGKEVMYELKFYKNGRILVGDADQGLLKVQIVDDGERVILHTKFLNIIKGLMLYKNL
jgi:hypothetical protein